MNELPTLLGRWIGGLEKRLKLLARRCKFTKVTDENPVQTAEAELYKGENRTGMERIQEYGFTSVPLPGAQGVVLFLGAECSHPAIVATDDRRYRPVDKNPGDVMLYTDKDDHHVYLVSETRVIEIVGDKVMVRSDSETQIVCGSAKVESKGDITLSPRGKVLVNSDLECTGDIIDRSRGAGRTMANMREIFDRHKHRENDEGGPTDPPMEKMG